MSRRRREYYRNDFDNCCNRRHAGGFGLISLLINLIVGVVTFGLTVAFKVVGAVFQSFFGTLSDMDRNRRYENGNAENMNNNNPGEQFGRQQTQSSANSTAQESYTQRPEAKYSESTQNKKEDSVKKTESKTTKEHQGADWNILIFVFTLIPAIFTLATGKLLYTAVIAAAGILLMVIYSSIRKISNSIKSKKAEKAEFEECEVNEENEVIETLIKEAFEKVYEVRRELPKVANQEIKARIEVLCTTAEKIIGEVRTNPETLSVVKKFFYYYLDAFCEIFRKYLRISNFNQSSEEIDKVVAETEKSFTDIEGIFKELCEKMLEKDMLNLKAEINVIKNSNA